MSKNKRLITSPIIHHFTKLGSTNDTAKSLLEEGQEPPFWVVSDEQTKGRGRRSREWVSLKGNLFASTTRRVSVDPSKRGSLSLVAGLAVVDAINKAIKCPPAHASRGTPQLELTLKWPNDILVQEAKLGGILIEAQPSIQQTQTDLIVGIGLNIVANPVIEGRDTICLQSLNVQISRDKLFEHLINAFEDRIEQWDHSRNIEEIKAHWMEKASPLGTMLTVKCGPEYITGAFIGLDTYGALQIKLNNNTIQTITGGELVSLSEKEKT